MRGIVNMLVSGSAVSQGVKWAVGDRGEGLGALEEVLFIRLHCRVRSTDLEILEVARHSQTY
jgi:hypothetical protein